LVVFHGGTQHFIGRLDEAREAAQYLVRAFPDYSLAYFNLGAWAGAAGMPAAGMLYGEKAARLNHEDGRSMMFAARTAIALGDADRAREQLDLVRSPETFVRDARRLRQRIDGQLEALIEAEQSAPEGAADGVSLAGALIQAERWEEGLSVLQRELPMLFESEPSVPFFLAGQAAMAVVALDALDRKDEAQRLGRAASTAVEPSRTLIRGTNERYLRLLVFAAIGDLATLTDELDQAHEFSQPRLADADGWPIRRDVRFRRALQDPRIEERVARMEAIALDALRRIEAGEVELLQP
jgi:tetratricopeptide (TPR) repeat protein